MYKSTRNMLVLSMLSALLISTPVRADETQNKTKEETVKPPTAVQLHFEVVELRLDAEQLQQIDQAQGPIDLEAMAFEAIKAKKARILYTIDAPIVVGQKTRLRTGTEAPYISGVVKGEGGESVNQIRRENVGCDLDFHSGWLDQDDSGRILVYWSIDLSDMHPVPAVELPGGHPYMAGVSIRQDAQSICKLGDCISISNLTGHRSGSGSEATGLAYVFHLCFDQIDDESDDEPAAKPVSKPSA